MIRRLVKRREFLSLMAVAPLGVAEMASASRVLRYPFAETAPATLAVLLDEPLGTINPRVYGQMTEHIGRVIYEGTWVGPDSKIPNIKGLRIDAMDALKRVKPSVIRWPGGCFADAYQWEDGIGPPKDRPLRHNHWWLREEPNTFGTDEFLEWCKLLNAEPFLTANVGTGSPAEALNWFEYCNGTGNTKYAQMRAKNGTQSLTEYVSGESVTKIGVAAACSCLPNTLNGSGSTRFISNAWDSAPTQNSSEWEALKKAGMRSPSMPGPGLPYLDLLLSTNTSGTGRVSRSATPNTQA